MARVSVVIPCYNGAAFIGAAIESALAQNHPDVEVIVVDDGSTDESWRIIESFAPRVRGERAGHGGVSKARNVGWRAATGEFVHFLDADDEIAPETLAALAAICDGSDTIAVAPWCLLVEEAAGWATAPVRWPQRPPGGDPLAAAMSGWFVQLAALLWPRALLERLGGFDEALCGPEDVDLFLRALVSGARLAFTDGGQARYRRHGVTLSKGRGTPQLQARMRVLEKLEAALGDDLDRHRVGLGRWYHDLARAHGEADAATVDECVRRALRLAGTRAFGGTLANRILTRLLGFRRKERLAAALATLGVGRASRLRPATRDPLRREPPRTPHSPTARRS